MITGVVLAHNEAQNILQCIAALRPHVGELLLIDAGSTDSTVAVARPHVDRILTCNNSPNFDALRNLAIPEARFDWLWFVDADEHVPEPTGRIVNDLVLKRGHEFEAITIPFKSYFCGQWMRHSGWWPGYTCCRVLKRGHFEFGRDLHSGVMLSGRELRFPPDPNLAVPHYSYRDLEHYVAKTNRYTSTEALQRHERGARYDWRSAARAMIREVWTYYELKQGVLDGSLGWILAWMAGQYQWLALSKLINFEPNEAASSAPISVDEMLESMSDELALCRGQESNQPWGVLWRGENVAAAEELLEIRCWVTSVAMGERETALRCEGVEQVAAGAAELALFRSLGRARLAAQTIEVVYASPAVGEKTSGHASVLRAPWPVDPACIPPDWIARARKFDELWVPTAAEKVALRQRGLAPERIRVIPWAASLDGDLNSGNTQAEIQQRGRDAIEDLLRQVERRWRRIEPPAAASACIKVELEGEILANHSFSNVNEHLARMLMRDPSVAVRVKRNVLHPTCDQATPDAGELRGLVDREWVGSPDITIRHGYPPNWKPPESGIWVHVQPWEWGRLPAAWIAPLREKVDEIWVPSAYVKQAYLESGISEHKIQIVPWGIDPDTFHPAVPPLLLPTAKSFRFLYVGGTVIRKGFDRLLSAFVKEFSATDDICLVIKEQGGRTVYSHNNHRSEIMEAMQGRNVPQIIYFEDDMTSGQLASLYRACDCLVAPYRGEGFGLPVLEAMACGTVPMVPAGGATDDFTSLETAYLLPSRLVAIELEGVVGQASEIDISEEEIRHCMRYAFAHREQTKEMGAAASITALHRFTWSHTAKHVRQRIAALVGSAKALRPSRWLATPGQSLAAVVVADDDTRQVAFCLSVLRPFVADLLLLDQTGNTSLLGIAKDYGAHRINGVQELGHFGGDGDWFLILRAHQSIREAEMARLAGLIAALPQEIDVLQALFRQEGMPDRVAPAVYRRIATRWWDCGDSQDDTWSVAGSAFDSDIVIDERLTAIAV